MHFLDFALEFGRDFLNIVISFGKSWFTSTSSMPESRIDHGTAALFHHDNPGNFKQLAASQEASTH